MISKKSIRRLVKYISKLRLQGSSTTFTDTNLVLDEQLGYEIAHKNIELDNRRVVAWKLGGANAYTQHLFKVENIYFGPLLEDEFYMFSTDRLTFPVLPVLAVEAEIALRLSEAGVTTPFSDELDPAEAFDAWAVALEFPYSIFSDLPAAGLGALLADRCAAGGLFLGQKYKGVPPEKFTLTLELNDGSVAEGNETSLLMTPLELAMEFRKKALKNGFELKEKQWISTGGVTTCMSLEGIHHLTLKLNDRTMLELKRTE